MCTATFMRMQSFSMVFVVVLCYLFVSELNTSYYVGCLLHSLFINLQLPTILHFWCTFPSKMLSLEKVRLTRIAAFDSCYTSDFAKEDWPSSRKLYSIL